MKMLNRRQFVGGSTLSLSGVALTFSVIIALSACSGQMTAPSEIAEPLPAMSQRAADLGKTKSASPSANETRPASDADETSDVIIPGNDLGVRMPAAREAIKLYGDAVSLNFEEAPLSEVVHSILGDTLGLDYIVEHPVSGEVTLRTRSPVPRDQLFPILEALLANNGALLVRGPNDRFFISGAEQGSSMVPSFESSEGRGTGFSNVIVPLQHISAPEMAEILKPVASERAFVRVDPRRNLLVLAGTQIQIDGWLQIISTFDVDQLAGTSVGIFPVKNGSVEEVAEELAAILSVGGEEKDSGIASMVRVMPVERLNSIMVVSPRKSYISRVGAWVKELDSVEDPTSEPTLHVYQVKNGNAGQLANLLSSIYGEGGGSSTSKKSQVAPGMTSMTSGSRTSGSRTGGVGGGAAMPSTGGGLPSGGSFSLGDHIKVVSDDYNNALLVYASPYEYEKIDRILNKLDVVATQVLIEASIVEVTLGDDLEYGLEWTFQNQIGSDYSGDGVLNLNGGDAIGALAPGFSYTVTNSAGAVRAVVNALAQKRLVNVISTPSVLVLDNHTAAIHVGDQQPIQGRQTVTEGGVVSQSVEYKDTGVKLQVTPSVNDGGLVTLDVMQSVTDVGPIDAATRQRTFLERNVSSRVAIRSGESVVLGGLIRDNSTEGKSGIPLLMDIPVLGSLFSNTTRAGARTELLVFITPRVMESALDLRDLGREMRSRMRGLTKFDDLPVSFGEKAANESPNSGPSTEIGSQEEHDFE